MSQTINTAADARRIPSRASQTRRKEIMKIKAHLIICQQSPRNPPKRTWQRVDVTIDTDLDGFDLTNDRIAEMAWEQEQLNPVDYPGVAHTFCVYFDAVIEGMETEDPDPDAYYAEQEREFWRNYDNAEAEREEQAFFEENDETQIDTDD